MTEANGEGLACLQGAREKPPYSSGFLIIRIHAPTAPGIVEEKSSQVAILRRAEKLPIIKSGSARFLPTAVIGGGIGRNLLTGLRRRGCAPFQEAEAIARHCGQCDRIIAKVRALPGERGGSIQRDGVDLDGALRGIGIQRHHIAGAQSKEIL